MALLLKFWRSTVYSIVQAEISSATCKGLTIVYLLSILPVETPHDHKLRERGHNFVLPRCQNNIYNISFLNKCLFSIV